MCRREYYYHYYAHYHAHNIDGGRMERILVSVRYAYNDVLVSLFKFFSGVQYSMRVCKRACLCIILRTIFRLSLSLSLSRGTPMNV